MQTEEEQWTLERLKVTGHCTMNGKGFAVVTNIRGIIEVQALEKEDFLPVRERTIDSRRKMLLHNR